LPETLRGRAGNEGQGLQAYALPVITGTSGRDRIFDAYPDVALDMISSRIFDGRIQLVEYVASLAGPLGTNKVNACSGTARYTNGSINSPESRMRSCRRSRSRNEARTSPR
jgi:hypothetical protein